MHWRFVSRQAPGKKARAMLRDLAAEQIEADTRVHVDFGSKLKVCLSCSVFLDVRMPGFVAGD